MDVDETSAPAAPRGSSLSHSRSIPRSAKSSSKRNTYQYATRYVWDDIDRHNENKPNEFEFQGVGTIDANFVMVGVVRKYVDFN